MNSSFKIKEPSHYYDVGVPSYQRLPFPQDHKIKLYIQPYLNGFKKNSPHVLSTTTISKIKKEKLFVEPYALSIVSKRVSKPLKKEVNEGNVIDVEEETLKTTQKRSSLSASIILDEEEEEPEMMPVRKKRRIIKYCFNNKSKNSSTSSSGSVSSSSSKDKALKSQASVSEKRRKESESSSTVDSQTVIRLSNGQFIRVPQSMLVNIQLLKQKSQALTTSPVTPQTSVPLSSSSCQSVAKVVKDKKVIVAPSPPINVVGSTTITPKQPIIAAKKMKSVVPSSKISPTIVHPVKSSGGSSPIILSSTFLESQIDGTKAINLPKTLTAINASSMIAKKSLTIERANSQIPPSQHRGKSLSSIVVNSHQSPQSHIIALKTQEKNGQVIYLKSIPNQKSPTPGATRLIVAQPPNQRLTTTNIQQVLSQTGTPSGVQLPLKLVNQPASSIEGISTPRNPVIVKRLIPSDLPRLNSQVNKGKTCSNSVGSPLNGKYRDIKKLSQTLKHVLSQSADPYVALSNDSESPKAAKLKSMVNVKSELDPLLNNDDSKSCLKSNHDYSCTLLRGVKLSEALMDISKRGIFVDTTAVKVDSSSCSGQISTVNIQVPQKDLLSFVVSKTRFKEGRTLSTSHSKKLLKSWNSTSATTTTSSSSSSTIYSKSASFSRKVLNSKSNSVHALTRKGSDEQRHILSITRASSNFKANPTQLESEDYSYYYIDEGLPKGWFAQLESFPEHNKTEIYHITSDNLRLRSGQELWDYLMHGVVPCSSPHNSSISQNIPKKMPLLRDMPIRKAVVNLTSLW